ncbi:MAG TPA: hypothetical protein VK466_02070, partial [Terriglobales bacterium]|nr:hypothetical protein [Terriglobales bacterium]
MTNQLTGERLAVRFKDGLAVLWRIRRHVEELGDDGMVSLCRDRIAYQYGQNLVGREVEGTTFRMSKDEFEQSLDNNSHNLQEMDYIKARTWEIAGDSHTRRRDFDAACACYDLARKYEPWNPKLWTKQSLVALGLGSAALTCRDAVFAVRRRVSGLAPNL